MAFMASEKLSCSGIGLALVTGEIQGLHSSGTTHLHHQIDNHTLLCVHQLTALMTVQAASLMFQSDW